MTCIGDMDVATYDVKIEDTMRRGTPLFILDDVKSLAEYDICGVFLSLLRGMKFEVIFVVVPLLLLSFLVQNRISNLIQ